LAIKYIDEPIVEIRPEQPYVAIAFQAALPEVKDVRELGDEIYSWLAERKLEPKGALFCRHWVIDEERNAFHVEVGIPVERVVAGDERVIAGFVPGGSYVAALHRGHPDHLAKSSNELEIWAKKEELELAKRWEGEVEIWDGRFAWYLADPELEPDPTDWKIKISYLLMNDDAA
jgi:effector-binding domain-containing protein